MTKKKLDKVTEDAHLDKIMTDVELLRVEYYYLQTVKAALDERVAKQQVEIQSLTKRVYDLQSEVHSHALVKANRDLAHVSALVMESRKQHAQVVSELKAKYKITGSGFSYDHETGVIVED